MSSDQIGWPEVVMVGLFLLFFAVYVHGWPWKKDEE